jgi:hypothetical protein
VGGKNGDRNCKDIMAPCEKQVDKIDKGNRALGVCRHFTMSVEGMYAENNNMDSDFGGNWRRSNPPIPGFGELHLFISPILRYPYRMVLNQVG